MENIQDEVMKIHHKYGTTEMANYQIQLLFDRNYSQLQTRIKELETTVENNVTELIHRKGDLTHDFWYFCAECLENFEMDENFNYCPNCGRKIIRK